MGGERVKRPFITEEHELFRASLRKFLEKEADPFYEQWEEKNEIPRLLEKL